MIEVPKFELNENSLEFQSDEQLQAELAKDGGKRKGFEPGNYKLKIVNPRFHVNEKTGSILCKDPTWFNVRLTLESADGRSKEYFVQVPTSRLKYGPNDTMFVYKKFQEFMAAIGEPVSLNRLGKLCEKYFSSEDALKKLSGIEIDVDMGYVGSHIEKVGDNYKIVHKRQDLSDGGQVIMFPDFQSAKAYAQGSGIEITFVEITKLNPNIKPVEVKGWE
jgi:hypothetical protein